MLFMHVASLEIMLCALPISASVVWSLIMFGEEKF
jgi:hypothetical protein